MCDLLCFAQIVYNPVYDRTGFEVFHPHVDKVEIKKDSIKVYCSITFQDGCTYGIPKTFFLEDLGTNKKYQIIKCIGLPFLPHEQIFNAGDTYQFVFCFPHIENLHQFNLIEDSLNEKFFNIYGIDITKCYSKSFEESEYKRFKNMSDFYKSSNNIDRFVEYKEQELLAAQYIFGIKSLSADACYIQLAYHYDEAGDYMKAIDLGIQALECDSIQFGVENKEYPVYANTLESLSGFYQNAGKETESLHCLQKCISIRRNIGDEKRYKNVLLGLLHTGYSDESILKRISIVNKELETLPSFIGITSRSLANIYKQLASSYSLINDNNNAIKYCNKALDIIENNGYNNSEYNAELLALKCHCQRMSGLKKESIASGTAAKQLYDSLDIKSLTYADLLDDLAWAYALDLNYERSIQLQKIAAGIYEKAEDWISLAEVYIYISCAYNYAEKLDDAERYIKKTINVLNEHDNAEQYMRIKLTRNDIDNDSSTLVAINRNINLTKAVSYQTLAQIYYKKENYTNAIDAGLKSGEIAKDLGDYQLYIEHLWELSVYYLRNHQHNDAKLCAEKIIKLVSDDYKIDLSKLAIIYYLSGDTIKSINYAEESVSESKSSNDKKEIIAAQSFLSFLYWKKREYGKAEKCLSEELDYLKNFISDELIGKTTEQKQRLWNKYEQDFLRYRRIIEKSERNDAFLSKLYDYVLFSKSLLLDADIKNNVNSMKITWKDIQQHLSDKDIAIEFMLTFENDSNITYHALIIDKNNPSPRMITLYSDTELEEIKKTDIRDISEIVGELIWRPIKAQYGNVRNIYFSPDGILHWIPFEYYGVDSTANMYEHYNIYRLSSTKELVKEHRNRQAHSAVLYGGLDYNQLAEANAKMDTNEIASVWRGIAERGGFDPLFNTIEESQEIKDILEANNISTTLYTGEEGTEESFRNLSNQNHSIIHLATHGMYVRPHNIEAKKTEDNFEFLESITNKNDPVKEDVFLTHSFLVMAGGNRLITRDSVPDSNNDGILTSKEISQLNLGGLDLVVLSACETALGDMGSDGVYGLQRAFKKAGANAILMSSGKVDDEATKILMVEFYKNLMEGKSKRQSLKNAQRYLRQVENGKYDAPEYWASFILLDGLN